jgi:hypothetical protein|tara:strand:- start:2859 stop:3104 length:246 start_codon:yes stop_codon:yes gene_type:complete
MSKKICYNSLFERINNLKKMRSSLSEKEKDWHAAFQASDWVAGQIKCLLESVSNSDTTKEDIENRLKDILCVIESGDEDEQ